MLEREKKLTNKKMLTLLLTLVLCMSTVVTAFAVTKVKKGERGVMKYTFTGTYDGYYLEGESYAAINRNKYSSVSVKFTKNGDLKNQNKISGAKGNTVDLSDGIGDSRTGWRVTHTASSYSPTSTTTSSVIASTIY